MGVEWLVLAVKIRTIGRKECSSSENLCKQRKVAGYFARHNTILYRSVGLTVTRAAINIDNMSDTAMDQAYYSQY